MAAFAAAVLDLQAEAALRERVAEVVAGCSWEANGRELVEFWRGLVRS